MTQVTLDNSAVKVTLNDGESVTVPTGETWKVVVHKFDGDGQAASVRLDGNEITPEGSGHYETGEMFLAEGTTVKGQYAKATIVGVVV